MTKNIADPKLRALHAVASSAVRRLLVQVEEIEDKVGSCSKLGNISIRHFPERESGEVQAFADATVSFRMSGRGSVNTKHYAD